MRQEQQHNVVLKEKGRSKENKGVYFVEIQVGEGLEVATWW